MDFLSSRTNAIRWHPQPGTKRQQPSWFIDYRSMTFSLCDFINHEALIAANDNYTEKFAFESLLPTNVIGNWNGSAIFKTFEKYRRLMRTRLHFVKFNAVVRRIRVNVEFMAYKCQRGVRYRRRLKWQFYILLAKYCFSPLHVCTSFY